MKKTLSFIVFILIFTQEFAQITAFDWVARLGGYGGGVANSVTTDNLGNVLTTGGFSGTVDFDPGPGIFNLSVTQFSQEIFISKLTSSGNFVWAKQFGKVGGTTYGEANCIVADLSGNVYVTGFFLDTIDFDPGTNVFNLVSGQGYDIFVVKLDSGGNFLWAKNMGTMTGGDVVGNSLTIDSSGSIYTTGYFQYSVDFDPGPAVYNLTSASYKDIFICKLDSAGNFIWVKQFSGGIDCGISIKATSSGYLYTTGYTGGTVDFDPGPGIYNITFAGSEDIFILKLDYSGNFIWVKGMGGIDDDRPASLSVDAEENIYTTGYYSGVADFDPGASVFNLTFPANGISDAFISKLDSSGNFVWAKSMGITSNYSVGYSISVNAGNVLTVGKFSDNVDFDPGTGIFNLSSNGSGDVFVSYLDSSGNFIWAGSLGGINQDYGESITCDAAGNIYTVGNFRDTVDFDMGPGTYILNAIIPTNMYIHKMHITTTGFSKNNSFEEISVFPNPSHGHFTIKLPFKLNKVTLRVYDVLGHLIEEKELEGTSDFNLNTSPGFYIMEISNSFITDKLKIVIE